jgi:hypothetical protein
MKELIILTPGNELNKQSERIINPRERYINLRERIRK